MSDISSAYSIVDPRLLEVLVCPVTRTPLVYDRAKGELVSKAARKQLLEVFEAAGPMSDTAKQGRKRLSAILFS